MPSPARRHDHARLTYCIAGIPVSARAIRAPLAYATAATTMPSPHISSPSRHQRPSVTAARSDADRHERDERHHDCYRQPVAAAGQQKRKKRDCPGHDKGGKCSEGVAHRLAFFAGQALRSQHALARSNRLVVAGRHRKAVAKQVRDADDEDHRRRQGATRHAGHDRERRDDAVVGAVDQVGQVVSRHAQSTIEFDVCAVPGSRLRGEHTKASGNSVPPELPELRHRPIPAPRHAADFSAAVVNCSRPLRSPPLNY